MLLFISFIISIFLLRISESRQIKDDQQDAFMEFIHASGCQGKAGCPLKDIQKHNDCNDFTNNLDCDSVGNVLSIDLKNCSLSGSIPSSLLLLSKLTFLDLSENDLFTTLPSIEQLTDLQTLKLSKNEFLLGGINAFPSSLIRLEINECSFNGSIPTFPSNVRHFEAAFNKFTGELPLLPLNLETLVLKNNSLEGSLPSLPATLSDIQIQFAGFSGEIQSATLTNLRLLLLQGNQFIGALPEFGNTVDECQLYNGDKDDYDQNCFNHNADCPRYQPCDCANKPTRCKTLLTTSMMTEMSSRVILPTTSSITTKSTTTKLATTTTQSTTTITTNNPTTTTKSTTTTTKSTTTTTKPTTTIKTTVNSMPIITASTLKSMTTNQPKTLPTSSTINQQTTTTKLKLTDISSLSSQPSLSSNQPRPSSTQSSSSHQTTQHTPLTTTPPSSFSVVVSLFSSIQSTVKPDVEANAQNSESINNSTPAWFIVFGVFSFCIFFAGLIAVIFVFRRYRSS